MDVFSDFAVGLMQVAAALAGVLTAIANLKRAKLESAKPHAAPVVVTTLASSARPVVIPAVEASLLGIRVEAWWHRFERFQRGGRIRFAPSWNWSALFLGGFWYLYRRVYGVGALFLALDAALFASGRAVAGTDAAPAWLACTAVVLALSAGVADYVYFRTIVARARKVRERARGDEARAAELAREIGGVSTRALVAAVVVFAAFLALVVFEDVLLDRRFYDQRYNYARRWFRRLIR